ncbi:MAG: VTT domain-containing protein [Alphaproteobacteria bacterium]
MGLLLGLTAALGLAVVFRDSLDPTRLMETIAAAGWWGPAIFMLLFAAGTVLFVPGAAYALAGGALFGPLLGTVFNLSGATLGAVLAFLVARHGAGAWVRSRTGPRLEALVSGVEAEGWRFVAFVRLVPLFPFNLVNYAFGLTRIGLAEYTAATVVCMIPGSLAYTYLGFAGREAVAGGEDAIRQGMIALALLAAVAFLPRLVRRWRGGAPDPSRMDVTALRLALDEGHDLCLVDVRDAADFTGEGGHVAGAVNIPLPELKTRMPELEDWRERPVAIMCRTDKRSKVAIAALRQQGHAQVILVEGGMMEWTRRGLPAERT